MRQELQNMTYSRSMANGKYVRIWEKYRPAILNLMIAADKEPQTYKLSKHEFRDVNLKKTSGYSFTMKIHQNKATTTVKSNVLAQDLFTVLQYSKKATELTESSAYEFVLDKEYVLHVRKEEATD